MPPHGRRRDLSRLLHRPGDSQDRMLELDGPDVSRRDERVDADTVDDCECAGDCDGSGDRGAGLHLDRPGGGEVAGDAAPAVEGDISGRDHVAFDRAIVGEVEGASHREPPVDRGCAVALQVSVDEGVASDLQLIGELRP